MIPRRGSTRPPTLRWSDPSSTMRRSVVFPEPLGPRRVRNSPGCTSSETPLSAPRSPRSSTPAGDAGDAAGRPVADDSPAARSPFTAPAVLGVRVSTGPGLLALRDTTCPTHARPRPPSQGTLSHGRPAATASSNQRPGLQPRPFASDPGRPRQDTDISSRGHPCTRYAPQTGQQRLRVQPLTTPPGHAPSQTPPTENQPTEEQESWRSLHVLRRLIRASARQTQPHKPLGTKEHCDMQVRSDAPLKSWRVRPPDQHHHSTVVDDRRWLTPPSSRATAHSTDNRNNIIDIKEADSTRSTSSPRRPSISYTTQRLTYTTTAIVVTQSSPQSR